MKRKLMLLLACLFVGIGLVTAQTQTITGVVISEEDGQPVIGASVLVKGTQLGTITGVDGDFTLSNVPSSAKTLQISFIGMQTQEVAVKPNLKVVMRGNAEALDEVVVIAYGTAKKESLTGSISVVDNKKIEKRITTSVTGALEGAAPGVQVNNTYGEPGQAPEIRIRGFGTLVSGASSPLYVVDGVPFDGNMAELNSNDIESMSILKDAASAALYGNRAANGVVLITTKSGRNTNKPSITLQVNQGIYNRGIPEYERLDADRWMEASWMAKVMVEDFMCNLKVYRVAQGLTQEQLAEKVGVRRETIMRLEKAQYNPSLKLAIDISRVLNAPIEDIFIFK